MEGSPADADANVVNSTVNGMGPDSITQQVGPSVAATSEGLSEEEVYDALLGASLSDDVVGKSAQHALQRLGQSSNQKLVQRAVDMLSQHAEALAEEPVANNVARRAALFRLLSSVVGNYKAAPPTGNGEDSGATVDVTDFLIEQVLNDIEWDQSATDNETAAEKEALREAAEQLLVQLASHHLVPVLTRLLSRLDGASMFQQQKAQAAARFRSRPGTQWVRHLRFPPLLDLHRLGRYRNACISNPARACGREKVNRAQCLHLQ